jgi:hypothetical protein
MQKDCVHQQCVLVVFFVDVKFKRDMILANFVAVFLYFCEIVKDEHYVDVLPILLTAWYPYSGIWMLTCLIN